MSNKEKFMDINLDFYSKEYQNLNKLDKYCKKPSDKQEIKTFNMNSLQTTKLKDACKKKCDSLKNDCNAFIISNLEGIKKCTTFKNCSVGKMNNSIKSKHYAKKYTESFNINTIFFVIVIIEMFVMILLGIFAYSKYLRLKLQSEF